MLNHIRFQIFCAVFKPTAFVFYILPFYSTHLSSQHSETGRSQISCFPSLRPAVPCEEDVAGPVRVWLLYLSGRISGSEPERSQTPKNSVGSGFILPLVWGMKVKSSPKRISRLTTVRILTNEYRCTFISRYLDGHRFHDFFVCQLISLHFCSFTI